MKGKIKTITWQLVSHDWPARIPSRTQTGPNRVYRIDNSVGFMTADDADTPVVLVVDDDRDLANLYAQQLENDYDVRTAYSGEEALESFDETIDVILLDRRMPGLSGDDVLEEITERGYDGGVIMLTAISPDYDVIDMAFDEYLVKPVTLPELTESISRIVALKTDDAGPQRLYALLSKKYTLEMRKAAAELREDQRYLDLLEEIEKLKADLDPGVTNRIDAEASSAAFGALDGETIAPPDFDEIDQETIHSAEAENEEATERSMGASTGDVLLDHVTNPIFFVDSERRIGDCNEAFVERFGYARDEVAGQPTSMLYVGRADDAEEDIDASDDGSADIIEYRTSDGSDFQARTTVVSLDGSADGDRQRAVVLEEHAPDRDSEVGRAAGSDEIDTLQIEEIEVVTRLLRHEISNDLNLVTGLLGQLQTEVDEAHHEDIEHLQRLLSRTGTKIDDFSEYMMTAGASRLDDVHPVELNPAVEQAVNRVEMVDEEAQFDVGDLESTTVRANDLLEVVIRNLLDNAVRHHDGDEPRVTVETEVGGDTVRLRVSDDGPGIPSSIRSTLTDPESKSSDTGGLGLGLYLVDKLIQAYDGSLRFEDRDPTGTIAIVELVRAD